ncbi:UDP-2,3-diacylglucosamine diphosphatase [Aurantivibrio plasticivorans]
MLKVNTLWISDVHLGNRDCHADSLLAFLDKIDCDTLYLVGDIVDMLALKHRVYWPSEHTEVMHKIHRMAQNGVQVIYIPGNHDMPLRHYDAGLFLNIQLHKNFVHETAKGEKYLCVHGDEFDHAVLYHAMNRIIGEYAYGLMSFMNRNFRRIRKFCGLPYWSLANYLKENISQARNTIEAFEVAAAGEAEQRGLDGIVCGHIHKPELRKIGKVTYCNDGDWTESCSALIENLSGEMQLLSWNDIRLLIEENVTPMATAA